MKTNWVREKLRARQPTIGCFMGLGSPSVGELLANAGYDWLVIETEHNGLDSAEIEHMLMALHGYETIPIVRIPSSNPVFIQRALDMGGMGILVPMVKSPAEAQAIVAAARYPPQGKRSWGPLRASGYTFDNEDYFNRAQDNILVALILETKEAVDSLEAIASVPGIDVLFVGTFDLCLSLGLNPMRQPYPEIEAIADRLLDISRRTGVAAGWGVNNPDDLQRIRSRGFTFISYGPDYFLLADAARTALAAFRR